MKISIKLFTLMIVIILLVVIGIAIQKDREKSKYTLLHQDMQKERETVFNKLFELKGERLESFVRDYTFWDDMVSFVNSSRNNSWASLELSAEALTSNNIDIVWIYNMEPSLAYSMNNLKLNDMSELPVPKEAFAKIMKNSRFCHFFIKTSKGIIEIRGATIHPSADPQRKTTPQGYFFAGHLLDDRHLIELSRLIEGKVSFASVLEEQNSMKTQIQKEGIIEFTTTYDDWKKVPVARINVQIESILLHNFKQISDNDSILFITFTITIMLIIFIFFFHWVNLPLKSISNTLKTENLTFINKLQKDGGEFGSIARLLSNFIEQRKALSDEIAKRNLAEKSLQQAISGAKCILWYADVEEREHDFYWNTIVSNEDSAQRLLPLDIPSGKSYSDVWYENYPKIQKRLMKIVI